MLGFKRHGRLAFVWAEPSIPGIKFNYVCLAALLVPEPASVSTSPHSRHLHGNERRFSDVLGGVDGLLIRLKECHDACMYPRLSHVTSTDHVAYSHVCQNTSAACDDALSGIQMCCVPLAHKQLTANAGEPGEATRRYGFRLSHEYFHHNRRYFYFPADTKHCKKKVGAEDNTACSILYAFTLGGLRNPNIPRFFSCASLLALE